MLGELHAPAVRWREQRIQIHRDNDRARESQTHAHTHTERERDRERERAREGERDRGGRETEGEGWTEEPKVGAGGTKQTNRGSAGQRENRARPINL
jgi:hypothetical protein